MGSLVTKTREEPPVPATREETKYEAVKAQHSRRYTKQINLKKNTLNFWESSGNELSGVEQFYGQNTEDLGSLEKEILT